MSDMDQAIGKLDALLIDMEKEAQKSGVELPQITSDPDDPWADDRAPPPPYVKKVRCAVSGYLLTLPFEKKCPMPDVFVKDNSYLRGMLKPVVKLDNQSGTPSTSAKEAKAPKAVVVGDSSHFKQAMLKVAKIMNIEKHPNSDKLYICQLDIGNSESRQVVAGLQKYIPIDALANTLVVVVANLRKAKLAGVESQAMILAADYPDSNGPDGKGVKTLIPPAGAQPGEVVFLEGSTPPESFSKQVSSKVWEKVVAGLNVKGGCACFTELPMVLSGGKITVPAPDGAGIH